MYHMERQSVIIKKGLPYTFFLRIRVFMVYENMTVNRVALSLAHLQVALFDCCISLIKQYSPAKEW